jgi:HEAT repeat protein/formylglycine-generating enzyme required for sulfatase activity
MIEKITVTAIVVVALSLGSILAADPLVASDRGPGLQFELTDGTVITGSIDVKVITIQTANGNVLKISVSDLTELTVGLKDRGKPQSKVRVGEDTIVGTVTTDEFKIVSPYGKVTVKMDDVHRIGPGIRGVPDKLGQWTVELRDKTRLKGMVISKTLCIKTRYGTLVVPLARIQKAIFAADGKNIRATCRNSDRIVGTLEASAKISFKTDKGKVDISAKKIAAAAYGPRTLDLDLGKNVTLKLTLIPAGKFMMGSPKTETGRDDDEGPQREVTISKPFYMGVYEVTQAQWRAVMGTIPWRGKSSNAKSGANNAATFISWNKANKFCELLSKKTGKKVSFPTEAQWEYACRAGSKTVYSFGDDVSKLGDYAMYESNTVRADDEYALVVGLKKPNAFGLYDMHGNVWECCRDWYDEKFYAKAKNIDPENTMETRQRVIRGGGGGSSPRWCRSANREPDVPDRSHYGSCNGFRVLIAWGESSAADQKASIKVEDLVTKLKDKNADVRRSAAEALRKLGSVVVPPLLAALKTGDADLRDRVSGVLVNIGQVEPGESVPAITELLKDNNADVRSSAAMVLGELGPEAEDAIPALIAAMKDKNETVSSSASKALGDIGPVATEKLIAALKDSNPKLRSLAARTLGKTQLRLRADGAWYARGKWYAGPACPKILRALVEAVGDKDPTVRSSAVDALRHNGPPVSAAVPALITILKNKSTTVRSYSRAAVVLGEIGAAAKDAVPVLIDGMKSKNKSVRIASAEALGGIGPAAKASVPVLLDALKEKDTDIFVSVAPALGRIGPASRQAVPALIKAMESKNKEVRGAAVEALGGIGPAAGPATGALVKLVLMGDSKSVRHGAARALGGIGQGAGEAIAPLMGALKSKDKAVWSSATEALCEMGPAAKAGIPVLMANLSDEDGNVRINAAVVLGRIGPASHEAIPALIMGMKGGVRGEPDSMAGALAGIGPAAVPALVAALKSKDDTIPRLAAMVLMHIGPAARAAVPALLANLNDRDARVRSEAAMLLSRLDPKSKAVQTALATAMKDRNERVRRVAVDVIVEMGSEAKLMVPDVIDALEDEKMEVRRSAASALGEIGPGAAAAVPALIAAMRNEDEQLQAGAMSALGKIGPGAKVAVPVLIAMMKDADGDVCAGAIKALGGIGPSAKAAVVPLVEIAKQNGQRDVIQAVRLALRKIRTEK